MTTDKDDDDEIDIEDINTVGDDSCDIEHFINTGGASPVPVLDEIVGNIGWICPICHYGISPSALYCPCRD